jgi:VWFA-related protein
MRTRPLTLTPLVVLLAIATAAPTGAQRREPPRAGVKDAMQVHVVNVDVFVTDPDGRPVLGLVPADFELLEDGKPVPITNFFAASPAARAGRTSTITPSGGVGGGVVPAEQALNLVIFVDGVNLTNVGRALVLGYLERFVKFGLAPDSRVMVATFDRSLRERCSLTTDTSAALAALDAARMESTEGLFLKLAPATDFELEMEYDLQKRVLRSLGQPVDSLAGLPGRTVLLYVSDGFPIWGMDGLLERPDPAVYDFGPRRAFDLFGLSARPHGLDGWHRVQADRLRDQLGELMKRANAGRVAFYTVNSFPERGWVVMGGTGDVASRARNMCDALDRQESLFAMSRATGGQPLFASTRLYEAFNGVTTDLSTYYSLGYSPSHWGDGRYHKITVRVHCEDVRVRHRMAYLDKPEEQRQADRTSAALLLAGDPSPLGLRASTGTPIRKGARAFTVPLTVTIPAARLVLLPEGDVYQGMVSICIVATDVDGRNSEAHREVFPIRVPAAAIDAMLRQETEFTFQLILRKGPHKVAVTARDEVAQLDATTSFEVTVGTD